MGLCDMYKMGNNTSGPIAHNGVTIQSLTECREVDPCQQLRPFFGVMTMSDKEKAKKGKGEVRFVAYITLPNGKRLYAKQVGIRAFPLPLKKSKD
jgi:hypothetical protein